MTWSRLALFCTLLVALLMQGALERATPVPPAGAPVLAAQLEGLDGLDDEDAGRQRADGAPAGALPVPAAPGPCGLAGHGAPRRAGVPRLERLRSRAPPAPIA